MNKQEIELANNLETLTEEEKSELVGEIGLERKGRRDLNAGLGMFVAIDIETFGLEQITKGVLQQLKEKPSVGRIWAQDYGRVIAAVHPTKVGTIELGEVGKETKSYVIVESTQLINPRDVSQVGGGKNLILLNDKPVTIEGLIVEVVHLVDEVVWEKSRRLDREGVSGAFALAVEEVIEEGIEILACGEDEILSLKKILGDSMGVRLYGSMVIKSVPKVMGAVIFMESVESNPIDLSGDVGSEKKFELERKGIEGNVSFGLGITLGKPLHVGHLLNLGLGELGRTLADGEQVRLFSNDTAPRVGLMLARLAEMRNEDVAIVADALRNGLVSVEEVVEAYRSREDLEDRGIEIEALLEVERGGGLLRVVEEETEELIRAAGFENALIVRESEFVSVGDELVNAVAPSWNGMGFAVARTQRGVKVLKKNDKLTATAKVGAFLTSACMELVGICLLDGEADSFEATDVMQSFGMNVDQMSGVGASIMGKVGSGTNGTLPTMKELVERFGEETRELVIFINLVQPMTSLEKPNGRVASTYFDFASKDGVFFAFEEARKDLLLFKQRVRETLLKLDTAQIAETNIQDKFLDRLREFPSEVKTEDLIANMRKLGVMGEDPLFNSMVEKWKKAWKGDIKRDLLALIASGEVKSNIDLFLVLRNRGLVSEEGKLPSKEIKIESRFLSEVLKQGYEGVDAIERTLEYQEKKLFFSKRGNPYLSNLERLLELGVRIDEWTKEDALLVKEEILINMTRLGISI